MKNKWLWITIIVIIILGGLIFWLNSYTKNSINHTDNSVSDSGKNNSSISIKEGNNIGDLAPDFKLKAVNGKTISLSDFRGKKVILNFWATTCPYCKAEMPALNQFLKNHEKDTVILAIDLGESVSKVQQYLDGKGYIFTVLLDQDLNTAYDYKVQFIPMSYFIDKDGVIRAISNGAMSYDEIEEYFKSIS
ncbi:MAG: TlpA family protein disulfide reductase [Thermoanaerobacteraceae bacterium]